MPELAINPTESSHITTLSTIDLLSLIIGNKEKIKTLCNNEKDIYKAINKSTEEMEYNGLTKLQANRIKACLEISRRINNLKYQEKIHIGDPKQTADYLMPKLRFEPKEQFLVLFVNTKNRIVGEKTVSQGTLTGCLVHPREVYKEAILQNAAAIIVAHNHPSGEPNPSQEDIDLTTNLQKAGETIGIPLLDHIIIGDGIYYSFMENGIIKNNCKTKGV